MGSGRGEHEGDRGAFIPFEQIDRRRRRRSGTRRGAQAILQTLTRCPIRSPEEDFERKAEKKISGWGLFGSKYEDAADFYSSAANFHKLGKAWDKARAIYIKLVGCHLKSDSKHEAASAHVDAANCYKKTSVQGDGTMSPYLDHGFAQNLYSS